MAASAPPRATSRKPQRTTRGGPVVTDSKTQPTTGKRSGHAPDTTFTAKSKKHGGALWVYRTDKAGNVHAVRPHSSGKPATSPGAGGAPASGAPAPGGVRSRHRRDQLLRRRRVQGPRSPVAVAGRDRDRAPPRPRRRVRQVPGAAHGPGHRDAGHPASAAREHPGRPGLRHPDLGSAAGAGAATAAQGTPQGAPNYGADVAKIGTAGAAGAAAVAQPQQEAMLGHAQASAGLMGDLSTLLDVERGRQKGVADQQVQDLGVKRLDLQGEKEATKVERSDKLRGERTASAQADIENELAAQTLLAGSEKAKLEYDAKLKEIKAKLGIAEGNNQTAADIAAGRNTTAVDTANIQAGATTDAANIRADSATKVARIAARAKKDAAAISGKAGGKGPVQLHTADGKAYTMTEADRKKWNDRRRASIDATLALRRAMKETGDMGKALKRVQASTHIPGNVVAAMIGAAQGKPATHAQRVALKTYFPGGVIPPGFIEGKVNN